MNYALRHCGLPSITLWELLLPNFTTLVCHEDNQAMIRICETGRNPTMRYLSRTHGLCIAWLYERFQSSLLSLVYEESSKMAADIFTKAFTDKVKWADVCSLVNIVDKDVFYDHVASMVPDPEGGGILARPLAADPPAADDAEGKQPAHSPTPFSVRVQCITSS